MTKVSPPPIYELLADQNGKPTIPWILFFNQIFKGDTGTTWTPTFTNLSVTGTPTITGRYYKISDSIVYFSVNLIPATDMTSVPGDTYINNFPLTMKADGICFAVSGQLGTNSGMCEKTSNRIYTPQWSVVTVPLTVVGIVEAS